MVLEQSEELKHLQYYPVRQPTFNTSLSGKSGWVQRIKKFCGEIYSLFKLDYSVDRVVYFVGASIFERVKLFTLSTCSFVGHSTLVIVCVYLSATKQFLSSDLEALLALEVAVILLGDFNCRNSRWDYPVANYSGNELERLEDKLNFEIMAPSTSAYYPGDPCNRSSMLDIAIINGAVFNAICIETFPYLDSDHLPVLLRMGLPAGRSLNPTIKIIN
ncbi:RNA-directed DNA polymerase from mobile element jockey [Eumeta japonica]|uniref:RNA-directed DNA polymerase from mobile element jockey n=1 Tax=Eumeta variegata TaxID=151549 RepID=A0A4C1VT62_EUMVA|nr:RNA-directed DNA polymerase from mobile element jockey [Eumeta japonica]